MSDEKTSSPPSEGERSGQDPTSLKGLTAAVGIEPAKPGEDSLLGCDIGGVTIVRLIAEGGMGRVYEGKQERPNRRVAVKVMRPGLTSPSILKRFEYEAEVLGRLQHPGIAHIYSVGVHRVGNATVPYFVMEYIADARSLTQYADDLKLPTRQRLDLFRSVCDAVAHGHQKGVIHRDLKPSNILVDATGQPKVIDFGVARATDSDMALTTMQTDVGQLIGTLQYMSPEQFDADPNDIDIRSDVYALGVILYELLAGKMPYDVKKKAIYEVMRIVKEEEPTPLSSFNRALKGDVAVIAGKCLEKERSRRYSSASELGSDVGRYLSGDAISASPPSFVDGLVRLAKKHRAAATAVAGVLASLVLALLGIGVFASRAEHARRQAEEASRIANERRQQAESAERVANKQRDIATQRLYEANVYRIQQLIKEHNYDLARTVLTELVEQCKGAYLPIELTHIQAQFANAILTLSGHTDAVNSVTFSTDGNRVATTSFDKTAGLWDAATGKLFAALKGHTGAIRAGVSSPDGTRLATRSDDRTVRLWDATTGEQLTVLRGHAGQINSIVFSPDGTLLATGSEDKTVRLWDALTGKQLSVLDGHGGPLSSLAFSHDGSRLATGSDDKTVRLWDATSGKQLMTLLGHEAKINKTVFSPDNARLATCSDDKTARLWDTTDGKELARLEGHEHWVWHLAFSSDGTRLATGSFDKTIRLWDATSGNQLAVLSGHTDAIRALSFSPNGTQLATGSDDRTARLWDTKTGKQMVVLEGHANWVWAVAFSPDGTRLATGSWDKTARLWDITTARPLPVFKGHDAKIRSAAFSPDGTRLATGSDDKTARLWDAKTGKQLIALNGHGAAISQVAFSPDGTRLATRSDDGSVRLWNATTGTQVATLIGHAAAISSLAFSPDSSRLATGSADTTAHLWDARSGDHLGVFTGHDAKIKDLIFSPDGSALATGAVDASVRLWDLSTCEQLAAFEGQPRLSSQSLGSMTNARFSLDGARLATWSYNTVWVWDATTGKQLAVIAAGMINCLAFSPDGTRLATGSLKTARLWNTMTGEQLATLDGHDRHVMSLAFSPDGSRLATGSDDLTVRLWDATSGKQLVLVTEGHRAPISAVTFSPDGTKLATGSWDKTARLLGVSNSEFYLARLKTETIARRLEQRITEWLRDGPETAVAKLNRARSSLTPDEYRTATNMILSRSAAESSPSNK